MLRPEARHVEMRRRLSPPLGPGFCLEQLPHDGCEQVEGCRRVELRVTESEALLADQILDRRHVGVHERRESGDLGRRERIPVQGTGMDVGELAIACEAPVELVEQHRDLVDGIRLREFIGAVQGARVVPDLYGEIDQGRDRRDRRDELSDAADILK
ncbi:MAG: hypothetical protein P8125_13495 [Gemmatimonadota bacterium]